ncbi:hypothetical protein [Streptomyces nigrescens]|uniref:hypothetical protein n=1 Tax=Streptomyces nigrescens TaxID=1920 RepID=UPI0036FFD897
MGNRPLTQDEQDCIVVELTTDIESLTEEKLDDLYNQLDTDHQTEVDLAIREFADNAVGSEHWDSDQ